MAASLQRQILQLEEMSRLQRRFTSDVSHELRTPLTTVRMAADLLLRRPRGLRPGGRAQRRAAAGRARPVRGAARRPAGDQPVRRRRRRPRRRADRPRRRSCSGWSSGCRALAERHGVRDRAATLPDEPVHRRGRPPPGRADPAQPARQRHRARRGPAGRGHRSAADEDAVAVDRPRPRRRPEARRGEAGVRPVLAGRPVPGPARPAAPGSACRSASRTPGCTAAGCRRGARPARARSSGSPCRPGPATGWSPRRCGWCPTTPAPTRPR